MRRSPPGWLPSPALPLDLHVLSLSLAFILSQDQTLRCTYLISSFSESVSESRRRRDARPAMAVFSLCLCTCSELRTGDNDCPLFSVLYYFFSLLQHVNDLSPAPRALRKGAKSGAKLLPPGDMAKSFHTFLKIIFGR